jgi:hypothetical protein
MENSGGFHVTAISQQQAYSAGEEAHPHLVVTRPPLL